MRGLVKPLMKSSATSINLKSTGDPGGGGSSSASNGRSSQTKVYRIELCRRLQLQHVHDWE